MPAGPAAPAAPPAATNSAREALVYPGKTSKSNGLGGPSRTKELGPGFSLILRLCGKGLDMVVRARPWNPSAPACGSDRDERGAER